jgi:hypothetical protein
MAPTDGVLRVESAARSAVMYRVADGLLAPEAAANPCPILFALGADGLIAAVRRVLPMSEAGD